ncbi:formate dehydrogenase accessory protein FdhE [Billgrantia endophytica]|uniref:Formate dehydrogenase accessory protein FdhE n=2 Tax=Billgrantia endophytica TaxID=2033802 RepID=A0A2N7U5U8_9GAMM|nr:formate dehydrogenase accessory protein FdhE [Halomonas endophytica]
MDPPAVVLPDPGHFAVRAQRLHALSERIEPLGAFLAFMAQLSRAQQVVLERHQPQWLPEPDAFALALKHGMPPLGVEALRGDVDFHTEFAALLDALDLAIGEAQRPLLAELRKMPRSGIDQLATRVLTGDAGLPSQRGLMPLVAAGLQVAWLRLALRLPAPPQRPPPEARAICPCCGSLPVASVIQIDQIRSGVRYLQCGLCATQWYLERAKCSVCDQTGKLDYLSLEDETGEPLLPVQAETCGDCHTYLKIVPREFDAQAEPLADDLASLALDLLLAEKGEYRRSGYNPFLWVGNEG